MTDSGNERYNQLVAKMREEERLRQAGYREKALKLFSHICARCAREFEGKKLRELTVHHRDHNHDNNPPDGSNWELLCIYCHDHEHTRDVQEPRDKESPAERRERPSLAYSPFTALKDRIKGTK